MGDFIDIAASVLARSEQRVEAAGQNIANIATPGYKRITSFDAYLSGSQERDATQDAPRFKVDQTDGRMMVTTKSSDIAISGPGFFVLNSERGPIYTRQGQFRRDADGRLSTSEGSTLSGLGSSDLRLDSDQFEVASDGAVTEAGRLVGKIAVVQFEDMSQLTRVGSSAFSAPEGSAVPMLQPVVRQGMLEASNVTVGDEMVTIMEALRRAESGQRFVGVYDDLMGRVISAMGQ